MSRAVSAVRHHAAQPRRNVEFFGHNFFQITSTKGTKIITDPVAPGIYPTPNVAPHAITVGREHPNHNYVEIAKDNPVILRGLGKLRRRMEQNQHDGT